MQNTGGSNNHELGSFYASGPLVSISKMQAKLSIGKADDPYEREADAVADNVLSGKKSPVISAVSARDMGGVVQTQQGIDKPEAETEKEGQVQSKSTVNKSASVTAGLQNRIQSLKGDGQALPGSDQAFFENRIGADFSDVRVHSDGRAARLTRSINARAFTHGRDVVFGAGQYSPGTHSGRNLLAHELTHVVQQKGEGHVRRKAMPPLSALSQPLIQLKKIDHRTLTWGDFKGRPRRSKFEAMTSSGFHDPKIKKVAPSAKSLKAVDSGEECRRGRRTDKTYNVNIALDPARIKVKAYMWQEKSWAKAWTTNLKARVRKCKAGLVKQCKAAFVKLHGKIRKKRKKAILACKKNYNKWRKTVIKESIKYLKNCRKALKGDSSSYEVSIGGKSVRASNVKQCKTVLMKQFRVLRTKQWSYSLETNGETAKAGTKKACGKEFAKRYEELARKSLSWKAEQAGEQATVTSKADCSKAFLKACKNRILPAASGELLKHEQLHFDITEVKARETEASLRSLVAGFDKEVTVCGKRKALRKAKNTLRKIFNKLKKAYTAKVKAMKATQKIYDKKTKHGKLMEAQATWAEKVSKELTK